MPHFLCLALLLAWSFRIVLERNFCLLTWAYAISPKKSLVKVYWLCVRLWCSERHLAPSGAGKSRVTHL